MQKKNLFFFFFNVIIASYIDLFTRTNHTLLINNTKIKTAGKSEKIVFWEIPIHTNLPSYILQTLDL